MGDEDEATEAAECAAEPEGEDQPVYTNTAEEVERMAVEYRPYPGNSFLVTCRLATEVENPLRVSSKRVFPSVEAFEAWARRTYPVIYAWEHRESEGVVGARVAPRKVGL